MTGKTAGFAATEPPHIFARRAAVSINCLPGKKIQPQNSHPTALMYLLYHIINHFSRVYKKIFRVCIIYSILRKKILISLYNFVDT
jgi:hypothetical protein